MKTGEQTDIEWIKATLKRVESKVDSLEQFQWKVIGASSLAIVIAELILRK